MVDYNIWSDKNIFTYEEIDKILKKLYIFICPICKTESKLKLTTIQNKKIWCKQCILKIKEDNPSKFKGENKLFKFLKSNYNVIFQFQEEWCNNKKFDFCLKEYKIIIELDGEQHFKQTRKKYKSPKNQLENDIYKMNIANNNGYSIIRLTQVDLWFDRIDWKKELDNNIKLLIDCKEIKNIYLSKDNKYDKIIQKLKITNN